MKYLTYFFTALIFTVSASAATFNVNTTLDTQDANIGNGVCADSAKKCSLRAAISEANALAGTDTINVPAGTYISTLTATNEDNNAGGDWDIKSSVSIFGAGPANTILRSTTPLTGAVERVIDIFGATNNVQIWNLAVERGRVISQPGGGIRNLASLYLFSVYANNNQSNGGGGIYTEGSLHMVSSVMRGNRCVSSASGTCNGGGIYARIGAHEHFISEGSAAVDNESNSAGTRPGNGGGIAIEASGATTTQFVESGIVGNRGGGSDSRGAGLHYVSTGGMNTLQTSNNVSINSNQFFQNTTGALYGVGMSIEATGSGQLTAELDDLHLYRNSINVEPSTGTTTGGNMFIRSNGGAIQLSMRNSSVIFGHARSGAGIAMLRLTTPLTFNATNVTFGLNRTSASNPMTGQGGAIHALTIPGFPMIANFDFCTFTKNYAGIGDAIYTTNSPSVYLKNSVVAGNETLMDQINGTVYSQNYNHFEYVDTSMVAIQPQDIVGTNPLSSVLTNNQYFLPLSPGLLVNMIPNGANECGTSVTVDQRGISRPQNGNCDKGAIEIQ